MFLFREHSVCNASGTRRLDAAVHEREDVFREFISEAFRDETFVVDVESLEELIEIAAQMAAVRGTGYAYPQSRGQLCYADADLYGPHDFGVDTPIPKALGRGGTSFVPFCDWLGHQARQGAEPLGIYLTDGYGSFPKAPPESPAMWVVSAGGLESAAFPFGQVVRMGG